MNNWILIVILICSGSVIVASEKVVVCYYGTWATYRAGLGKFAVENVNTDLCSHVIYTFTGIDYTGTMISLDPGLDLDTGNGNFRKFTNLKQQNSKLKTMLAVGGWNEGSAKYSAMAANEIYRQNFIKSTLALLQEYNFDGLDLDWEYPNRRDTVHGTADIDNFTQLVKELREEFDKYGLLLTAAVSSVKTSASQSYDIPAISKYLDFIHIMTYDMYGAWDPVTGHNSPLHKGEGDTADREELSTVDVAVEYWLRAGCPAEKLVMGMPLYGRTFTLTDSNTNGVRAPSRGAGLAGPYTLEAGYMGYNEICARFLSETWDVRYDSLAKVPYAVQGVNWVSFDDADSITKKVEYALSMDLAGVMVWSIETDDFHNTCGGGEFPLLTAINAALRSVDGSTTESTHTTEGSSTSGGTTEDSTTEDGTTKDITTEDITTEHITTEDSTGEDSTTQDSSIEDNTTEVETSTDGTSTTICLEESFIANPEDCSTFFICVTNDKGGYEPTLFHCPPTTLWDQLNLICNYPDKVTCQI